MKLFTKSTEPDAKLGVAERLSYMCGNWGTELVSVLIGTYLIYFYTDVMYLDSGVIGVIMLVSRVFDGVTDILMGMIVDRTKSKKGRGRVWLLRCGIPFAISAILVFSVPGNSTALIQYIYVFITYNLCNAFLMTSLKVPYSTMMVNITSDSYERGLLGVFSLFGSVLASLAIQSTVDSATKALGGDQRAWQITILIYVVIGLFLTALCYFGTKERTYEVNQAKKINIKDEMKALIHNKYWLIMLGAATVIWLFVYFVGNSGLYYTKAVLGDTAYYSQIANALTITELISVFIAFVFIKKLGKRNTMLLGVSIVTAAGVIQCFGPENVSLLIICSAIKGVGAGFGASVLGGAMADTIDYGTWKFGVKADGVGMAAYSFVGKAAGGIASVVIGMVNKLCGYNSEAAVQTPGAIFGLKVLYTYLPLLCGLIAVVLILFYDLEKLNPTIQEDLKNRREE